MNQDTNTPESDAAAHSVNNCQLGQMVVPADFARQLERQRNEARRCLAESSGIIKLLYRDKPDDVVATCNQVLGRIDDANKKNKWKHGMNDTYQRLLKAAKEMADFCAGNPSSVQDIPDVVWIPFNDAIHAAESLPSSMESELAEALRLIIKGYAHNNPVGNNWRFVEQVEAVLARYDQRQNSAVSSQGNVRKEKGQP